MSTRQPIPLFPVALLSALLSVTSLHLAQAQQARSDAVVAISPGRADERSSTVGRCPTFSWTLSTRTHRYEIAVYERLDSGWAPEPVLARTFPPATSSWTPGREECLGWNRSYAWAVCRLDPELPGEFSAPLFFRTEAVTEADLRAAIEVLDAWRESGTPRAQDLFDSGATPAHDRARSRRASRRTAVTKAGSAGPGALAAIRGASTTTSTAAVGVEGSSASSESGSAGVFASSSAPSGTVSGLRAVHQSSQGVAALLEAPNGGRLITGVGPTGEVLSVDSAGLLSAAALAGDGSSVTSVDAQTVGGFGPTDFAAAAHVHAATDIVTGTLPDERIDSLVTRDDEVLPIVLANDGPGSTLDADTLDGLEASDFVNGDQSCPPGQVVQGLDSAGTLDCGLPILPVETHAIVDGNSSISPGTLAVDGAGLPAMAYTRSSSDEVVLARCHNVYCSSSTKTVVGNGYLPALTFQQTVDGFPAITYTDSVTQEVWLVLCGDDHCTRSDDVLIADLDSGTGFFRAPVGIGASARPVVAFYEGLSGGDGQLRIATCTTPQCSSLSLRTLASGGDTGRSPALAINSQGYAVIVYQSATDSRLELARCLDDSCLSSSTRAVSGAAGGLNPAIVLNSVDHPRISYYDGIDFELKVAACSGVSCQAASDETLTSSGPSGAGRFSSIVISPADGNPLIAFEEGVFLSIADCNTPSCSVALIEQRFRFDLSGDGRPSMQLGEDGIPLIGYGNENGLALLRCQGPEC